MPDYCFVRPSSSATLRRFTGTPQPAKSLNAPVEHCELCSLRGLAGGEEVWREIDRFFAKLKQRAP